MRVANRILNLTPSATVVLVDKIAQMRSQGHDLVDLTGGEPDFDTPQHITDEAIRALSAGDTHYTNSSGIAELRAAIADKLRDDNGIDVDPATDICVTPSAKHALFIAIMTVLDPGDELLVMTPSWVSYQSMAQLAGGDVVNIPLSENGGRFRVTRAGLEAAITPRSRALLVNTPNNPTGSVLTADEIEAIVSFAEDHDLFIISDEIYEKIIYAAHEHRSVAAHPKAAGRTFTVNGFSKGYAMTGWRLGYVAGPTLAMQQLLKVHQHTVSCATSFVQRGGTVALTGTQQPISDMTHDYQSRRDLIVDGLNGIRGVRCGRPGGAFYVFPNFADLGIGTSIDIASWLLQEAQVAVTPGEAFGPGGEGHVRLSFATSTAVLSEAARRIEAACERHWATMSHSVELAAPDHAGTGR